MLEFRKYRMEYYFTFEEFVGVKPYTDNIDWIGLFTASLPYAPLYKTVGDDTLLKDYVEDLLNQVYSRFHKHYIYWCCSDTVNESDLIEITLKLANIIINTYDRYAPLYKYYKDKENSLMDMIQSETEGNIRYNDTPQNGGDFSDDAHTTNITQNAQTNRTEMYTPMERLKEIKDKLSSILFEWSEEFDKIFLEEGNI